MKQVFGNILRGKRFYNYKTDLRSKITNTKSNTEKIGLSNQLGFSYLREYDFDNAKSTFNESYQMGISEKDQAGLLNASVGLAETLYNLDDYESAIPLYEFILRSTKSTNLKRLMTGSYIGLGNCYRKMLDLKLAEQNYLSGLETADNEPSKAFIYDSLGIVNTILKNTEKAKEYFEMSLQIATRHSPKQIPVILHNYGTLSIQIGNFEVAKQQLEESAKRAEQYEDHKTMIDSKRLLRKLSDASKDLKQIDDLFQQFQHSKENGRLEQAELKLLEAIDISRELKSLEHESFLLVTLSDLELQLRKEEKCMTYLTQSIKVSKQLTGRSEYFYSNLASAASIFIKMGKYREARQIYQDLFDSNASQDKILHIRVLLAEIEYLCRNFQISKEISEKVLKVDPNNIRALEALANAVFMMREWSLAKSSYDSAHKRNSQNHIFLEGSSMANLCERIETNEKLVDMILEATYQLAIDSERSAVLWNEILNLTLDHDLRLMILTKLALGCEISGRDDDSLNHLQKAEILISNWKGTTSDLNIKIVKIVYYHLIRLYSNREYMQSALNVMMKMLPLETDLHEISILKFDIGMANLTSGNFEGAKPWLEEALVYFEKFDPAIESQCLTYLGEIQIKIGNKESARSLFMKALSIAKKVKNNELETILIKKLTDESL
jgi:tetratricopeptide (TPR) repeat protein